MSEVESNPEEDDDLLFEHHRIIADPKQSLVRIDKFLMDRLPNVTRTKIQGGIQEGFVKVNEKNVKSNYKVRPGDVITVSMPEPPRDTDVIPENIPITIVFEDPHLMVINKPAGMVVHPAYQNWSGTLVNALAYHFQHLPELPGNDGRPGLVHRIDKDTSGLLVIAKDEATLTGLAKQFFDHTIERRYQAIVWGVPDPPTGTINKNVGSKIQRKNEFNSLSSVVSDSFESISTSEISNSIDKKTVNSKLTIQKYNKDTFENNSKSNSNVLSVTNFNEKVRRAFRLA